MTTLLKIQPDRLPSLKCEIPSELMIGDRISSSGTSNSELDNASSIGTTAVNEYINMSLSPQQQQQQAISAAIHFHHNPFVQAPMNQHITMQQQIPIQQQILLQQRMANQQQEFAMALDPSWQGFLSSNSMTLDQPSLSAFVDSQPGFVNHDANSMGPLTSMPMDVETPLAHGGRTAAASPSAAMLTCSPSFQGGLSRREVEQQTSETVRRKNNRFEIPPGRTLANIDKLIADCNDEKELKELKRQKRLLRNRQAALDSRHRKKRHAEVLEKTVEGLEEQVADFIRREKQYQNRCRQLEARISSMKARHESTTARLTQENAQLRGQLLALKCELRQGEDEAAAANPSSSAMLDASLSVDSTAVVSTSRPGTGNFFTGGHNQQSSGDIWTPTTLGICNFMLPQQHSTTLGATSPHVSLIDTVSKSADVAQEAAMVSSSSSGDQDSVTISSSSTAVAGNGLVSSQGDSSSVCAVVDPLTRPSNFQSFAPRFSLPVDLYSNLMGSTMLQSTSSAVNSVPGSGTEVHIMPQSPTLSQVDRLEQYLNEEF